FDARTGAMRWVWDPIPRTGSDPAQLDWQPDQLQKTGAANAWAPLAADIDRRMVFVPTGSASPDFYGGERRGSNRYANSLVALAAETGRVIWAQQLVHHDVWDYDVPAQPTLVELEREGKMIPAVLQATKMGFIFSFHRETGEPLFAIEERPVPRQGEAGEDLSPTQPFPVAPPPLTRQSPVTEEDAFGFALVDKWLCAREIARYRSEGIYTPPSVQGSLMLPGWAGGMNWGGLAVDPATGIAVANVNDLAGLVALIPRDQFVQQANSGDYPLAEFAAQAGTPYGMRRQPLLSIFGAPCVKPPWGTLAAVDMRNGTIKWQVPLGTTKDLAPWPLDNMALGVPNIGGPIITAGGLIFIAAATDNFLRAFDLETGEELWKGRLPAGGQATPMTYSLSTNGRQYIVIASGGHPGLGTAPGDYLVAFSL
ncbi:MAG: PQQ-binding-like beta-propeller repeat protein, partial [Gammaproteobacteria bacterium]|nr:PQQ-binding-like beta-propeller repeat protein [Gammaproteobacteria bacterium]